MAIVRLGLKPGSWEGDASLQRNGLLYEITRRQYSATYLCHLNKFVSGPEQIYTDPACFLLGSAYAIFEDSDELATCVHIHARSSPNPMLWELDVNWDTDRIVGMITDNPLNQPPDIRWSYGKYERPFLRSHDGIAVLNSSTERFDPMLMYEEIRPILTIVRNEEEFNPDFAREYHNALNAEPFAGADVLHAKVNSITGNRMLSNGILFWQVSYEIEMRKEGFPYLVLDQGFRDADKKVFRDPIDFAPLNSETLLNGRGGRMVDAVTRLQLAIDDTETTIELETYSKFPYGQEEENDEGWRPSGDTTFDIRIDDEILTVISDKGTFAVSGDTIEVIRGVNNTTPAAHAIDAIVTLEPYYKRFIPFAVKSFVPLALPTI